MKTTSFKRVIKAVDNLNTQQFRIMREYIEAKASRKCVSQDLETPYDEMKCPHCGSVYLQRWGKRSDMQRYRCKSCKKTFNSLTGTPLARLRRKGHWLDYARCMKEGLSIRKAASVCGVHRNTAFRWRHRFLQNTTDIKADKLNGIVEGEEAYFLKSEKGNKHLVRLARKRGIKSHESKISDNHVCVFVSRDRNRNVFDAIFDPFDSDSLRKIFHKHLSPDALFCSDSKAVYKRFAQENQVRHGTLNLSSGEQVKKDIVHIMNVNSYQNQLNNWIVKRFRGVATKYLNNYISWYRELDEFSHNINPLTILIRAKSGGIYKNLPQTVT